MRSALTLGLWIGIAVASPQRLVVDGVTIDLGGSGGAIGIGTGNGGAINIGTGGGNGEQGAGNAARPGGTRNQAELTPGGQAGGQTGGQTGGQIGGSSGEAGGAKNFIVTVGGGADVFIPNILEAPPGSKVEFQFNTGNHTVTQGTFDGGCAPLQLKDPNAFHSGHIPYKTGQQEVGTFTMQINDTKPLAILCTTGPHRKNGQVMVINATPEQLSTFSKTCMADPGGDDAQNVVGGVVGQIPLSQAAFVPLPEGEGKAAKKKGAAPPEAAPPPGAAPPAGAAPAGEKKSAASPGGAEGTGGKAATGATGGESGPGAARGEGGGESRGREGSSSKSGESSSGGPARGADSAGSLKATRVNENGVIED